MSSKKSLLIILAILIVFCFLSSRILKLSHHKRASSIASSNLPRTTESRLCKSRIIKIGDKPVVRGLAVAKYINSISRVIAEESKKIPGTPGVVFYDLKLDKGASINQDKEFPAASLIKVPILIEFYSQVNQGKINPQTQIILKEKDKIPGGGVLKYKAAGSKFTLDKLAELMITESDNIATDILINLLDFDNINETIKELGCKNTFIKRTIWDFDAVKNGKDNITTPEDMALILRKLYQGEVVNKEISDKVLNIMKKTKRKDMIPAELPKDVIVAHKTGELSGMVHDVGIIYYKDNPYILCLLSKNVSDIDKTIQIWFELSKKIYEAANNSWVLTSHSNQ